MNTGLLLVLNTIIFGSFLGLHTKNIYTKIGRNPTSGFFIGFFLQGLGLLISLCLSPKNGYKPQSSLTKRISFGIGRLFIFSILNQILITEMLSQSNLLMIVGPIVYSMITYGFLILGITWIFRGNNNFLKLG